MSVNEYITKFTQLSRYGLHEVDTDEKKQESFLNGLNDGLAYALETQDFENFQGMVNKALMLENRRDVMERKRKLVHQYQSGSSSGPRVATSSAGPVFHPAQPQFQPWPQAVGQGFSTPQHQVIQRPNNPQIRATGNHSVQRTQATQDPLQADCRCYNCGDKGHCSNRCPNPCTMQIRLLHLPPLVESTLFLLLPSRTMFKGESTMLLWRKPRKLRTWSLVCFSSMTLLQLCYLIMEHSFMVMSNNIINRCHIQ
jgi:hypothetical protein